MFSSSVYYNTTKQKETVKWITGLSVFVACVVFQQRAYASVDYLMVNPLTQEYFWASAEMPPGFIGWDHVHEDEYVQATQHYHQMGYSETSFPYKIEVILLIMTVLTFLIVFFQKYRHSNAEKLPIGS
jgi:hypothetical protein